MFRVLFAAGTAFAVAIGANAVAQNASFTPRDGFVPDDPTAIAIAEAVLSPIYGHGQVENQRPFTANPKDGTWTVSGRLKNDDQTGGVAVVIIEKATGRIISVTHGR
jgi:hypothetical protein